MKVLGLRIIQYQGYCRNALSASVPEGFGYLVTPKTEMSLGDYFIDQYEVTIQSYQDCVNADVCSSDVLQYIQDFSPFETTEEPMRYISYLDAEKYCEWRGGYIPSEGEWEYASRGPENLAFPWGDEFDGNVLNFCDVNCQSLTNELWDDGYTAVAPVSSHLGDISWVGVIGMTGNVSEWTSTTYENPTENSGNTNEAKRVTKGGYFGSTADQVLLWRRLPLFEEEIRAGIGFRCAKQL